MATSESEPSDNDEETTITVEDGHLKEAMNMVYGFCEYMTSIHGNEATRAQKWSHRNDFFEPKGASHHVYATMSTTPTRPPPPPPPLPLPRPPPPATHGSRAPSSPPDPEISDDMSTAAVASAESSDRESKAVAKPAINPRPIIKDDQTTPRPSQPNREYPQKPHNSLALDEDSNLRIPQLNRIEWDAFQAVGNNKELFRKTSFYAVDVLEGEPMIKLDTNNNAQRRNNVSGVTEALHHETSDDDAGEAALPERIRINSPALIKAISRIVNEKFSGPFLIFRPYRSLIYYEQDLRDWAANQEKVIEGKLYLEQLSFPR